MNLYIFAHSNAKLCTRVCSFFGWVHFLAIMIGEYVQDVKMIFRWKSKPSIWPIKNIPTPGGKKVWCSSTVQSILQNEKYKGDALLQKSYTVDFLTKKKKINEGEVPQYYVENSHPAIIEPETFDLVQLEMKKRKEAKGYKTGGSCFSGKIVCGE